MLDWYLLKTKMSKKVTCHKYTTPGGSGELSQVQKNRERFRLI